MFRSSDLIESRMRHKYGCFFLLIILNSHILNLLVTCLTSHVLYLIKKQQSDKFFSPTSFFLFSHLSLFKEYNLQKKMNFNVNLFRIRTKASRTLGIEKIKLIWHKQLYFSSYNLKDSFHFWNLIILFWKLAPVEVRMS